MVQILVGEMDVPVMEELPVMRSMSPSTVFGEPIEIDYSQTLIKDPIKTVEITPSETSLPRRDNDKKRKKKSSEDLALIEALWKQDVDLGVPRELFDDDVETVNDAQTKDKDHGKKPKGDTRIDEKSAENMWLQLNFTIDSETGEQLLSPESQISGGDVIFEPVSPLNSPSFTLNETVPEFNLDFNLDEALKFVGLNCSETGETIWKSPESVNTDELVKEVAGKEKEESEDNLDVLNDSLDDMIQASQLHSHHPRSLQVRWPAVVASPEASQQGRLGSLVRSGEMERWQEVVQYLGLPNPHHTQAPHTPMAAHTASPTHSHAHGTPLHHPHALYPTHDSSPATPAAPVPRGVLINNATLPPPMSDPMTHNITYTNSMGASSHLVTSSMNLTNSSDLAGGDHSQYKMETTTTLPSEMMYYQNTSTEMNQTTDGLLSSILNDEALGLMEMAMNDSGCVLPQLGGDEGVDASSDSAVSSLSPDEPWGTVDHTTQSTDSGSRNQSGDYNTGSYRYGPEDPHRMPPLPLKKQHMFGRGGATGSLGGGSSSSTGVGSVGGYGSPYPPPATIPTMEGATALDPTEMKYSCTMDFRSQGEVSGSGVEHVQHNHTYHMSPEGPSGLSRPTARDKQRNRKNDHERTLTRDEKRARAMNLPISCEDIINLPMDEFNERISKYDLTEAQLSLIRDIRRRGKNKVAAQNCRKRKLDQILHLADEVKAIQNRKNELYNEFEYLNSERTRIKHKFSLLYRHIFQSLRDPDGNPYSPHEYSLQQSADGSILLVPRSSPSHSMDPSASNKPRGKDDPKQ